MIEILTERLLVREFVNGDFDALSEYENHPQMLRFEKGLPNDDSIRDYLQKAHQWANEVPRTHYRLAVVTRSDSRVRGRVSLFILNTDIREWEIGWAVNYQDWGSGYATEAARAMVGFAFRELNAHRVVAFCHASNAKSVRVMEKIGMTREGILRETRWWDGGWCNEFVYAILESSPEYDSLSRQ